MIAVRARIHGKVQGVGYRAWTVREATSLQLDGWVRNRIDGTVEALFVGDEQNVKAMLDRCLKGPLLARVKHVETEPAQGITEKGFQQKPTV